MKRLAAVMVLVLTGCSVGQTGLHPLAAIRFALSPLPPQVLGSNSPFGFGPTDPQGLAVCPDGSVFIADHRPVRIRRWCDGVACTPGPALITVAGTGVQGESGDGGKATDAQITYPFGIVCDSTNGFYFTESNEGPFGSGRRVRYVDPSGIISTVAGNGTATWGEMIPATGAGFAFPYAVTLDGGVDVADIGACRVARFMRGGTIRTVAGSGACSPASPDGVTPANIQVPRAVTIRHDGTLCFVEQLSNKLRCADASGALTTLAGNGFASDTGDGGQAVNATLNAPTQLAQSSDGSWWIGQANGRVRRIDPSGVITTPWAFSTQVTALAASATTLYIAIAAEGAVYAAPLGGTPPPTRTTTPTIAIAPTPSSTPRPTNTVIPPTATPTSSVPTATPTNMVAPTGTPSALSECTVTITVNPKPCVAR